MPELKSEYISVNIGGRKSYGGSQLASRDSTVQKCGCGIIAAADLLIYLARNRKDCAVGPARNFQGNEVIPQDVYDRFCLGLKKRYFPLLPPLGMNGIALSLGLNLYFARWGLPLKANWSVPQSKLWASMEDMLLRDIPVVFAVGPNFPKVWKNERLNFYVKRGEEYAKANSAKAHFITLTGIDGRFLRISSWGKMYYIKKSEFTDYVRQYSLNYISSILYISEK